MTITTHQNYPYLWVARSFIPQLNLGELVNQKYRVISPQIWQDIYPEKIENTTQPLPAQTTPYLHLFPQRLHIPEVYGVCSVNESPVILLNNAPIDVRGNLYPSLTEAWGNASPVQQVYWLWQILQLWQPLSVWGVATSLFEKSNLRVQGWRVRLLELYSDTENLADNLAQTQATITEAQGNAKTLIQSTDTLAQLAASWIPLIDTSHGEITQRLADITTQMQTEGLELADITPQLNQLLLDTAGKETLRSKVVGVSDVGKRRKHNEDSCYPTLEGIISNGNLIRNELAHHFMIVCDGLGGHAGGEIASQLAVQSLKLQVGILLQEISQNQEIFTPEIITEYLEAIIRITNNVISARNDEQERESRQRMGTTLVMALQLPQPIPNSDGETGNSHELYLAHVGDSRAYWLTAQGCLQLTVDDDVASQEVISGHRLYKQALQLNNSGALTQALGTNHAQEINPHINRFVIAEDGLLLLCSDGLSDNDLVELYWQEFAPDVLQGDLPLDSASKFLLELANHKNGHDNISFVLCHYQVSQPAPVIVNLDALPTADGNSEIQFATELQEYEQAFSQEELPPATEISEDDRNSGGEKQRRWWQVVILVIIVAGLTGFLTQRFIKLEAWESLYKGWFKEEVDLLQK